MRRIVGQITEDGEVLDGAVLGLFYPKRRNGFDEGWVAMAQPALIALAKSNLGQQDLRVLMLVLGQLDFENYILLNQADISREIDMHRTDVNKALKRLQELGVLLRGPKAGRSSTFRLNPSFGWKGSATNHQKALQERMRVAGLSVIQSDSGTDAANHAELESLSQQRPTD